ncbi:hypothetical protein ACNF40_01545 [Cuniculiplasma sp. SKW4]|uniref:hypothetical protein n=1 Tax=Cuniculiplasma sp. SKW4 TaxID=3400171 RepID=UPI003FD487AD
MTKIEGLIGGIFPKPEELRVLIGRWERGLINSTELENNIVKKTEEFDLLAEGIRHTEPLYNWYDIFRPIVSLIKGVNLGPLTRFEETNTFYRIPEFDGQYEIGISPLSFHEIRDSLPLPVYKGSKKSLLFAPGPLTLLRFSKIQNSTNDEDFLENIMKFYSSLFGFYDRSTDIFLMERVPLTEGYSSLIRRFIDLRRIYLFTSGQIKETNFSIENEKFKSIITDMDRKQVEISSKYSHIPGVKLIDAHNTRLENEEKIKKSIEELNLDRIIVGTNDYLDFLPNKIAEKKVQILRRIGE